MQGAKWNAMSEPSPTSRECRGKGKRADRHIPVAAEEREGQVDEGEVEERSKEGEVGEDNTKSDEGCSTGGGVVETEEERQKEAHHKESEDKLHTSALQHDHAGQ